jgi:molybdenum cofactor biosynthesis enzyme MoaA
MDIQDNRLKIYTDRLIKEWKMYGKIIIGVDFDSTISPYHTFENSGDIKRTIDILKECKHVGCYIVIHTACNDDRYEYIREYVKSIGLDIDTINQTPFNMEFGNNGSKPYCNIYIDDRSCLPVSLDILEFAMYSIKGSKKTEMYDF